ncbi:AraC family transcriptional regulator [Flavobacterium sp. N2155]|nr:AraC family transcriptional regulator [Flavobacterium sp. N2155]
MDYYKQQKNEEKQLYYTNQLLKVTVFLQNEYRFLSTALHKQLDIKYLESEKARLEYSLQTKSRLFTAAIVGGSLLLIGFAVALLWNYLKKKEYSKRYNELVAQRKNAKAEEKTQLTEIAKPAPVVADVPTNVPEPSTVVDVNTQEEVRVTEVPASIEALTATPEISQPVEKEINSNSKKNERSTVTGASNKVWESITQYLEVFEENQGFLDPNINLNQLAVLFETNRSYLSSYINASKEKTFNDYVNQLRIDYLLAQFESNPQWIHYKISHIAELLGFPSSRSFSNAFIKCTGISPSFYIGQLKEEAQT